MLQRRDVATHLSDPSVIYAALIGLVSRVDHLSSVNTHLSSANAELKVSSYDFYLLR